MVKRLEADMVVIGGGTAGLAAAITAAEGGASVIVFEKEGRTGGAGNAGGQGGIFAAESRLQRERGIQFTREQAFKFHMDFTHWLVDARLVKEIIDRSASTMDWLEKMGVVFMEPAERYPGSAPTYHTVKGPLHGFKRELTMMKRLTNRAKELGVQIFLKTPAKKILKEGGRIVGAIAEDKSGETIQANSRAVFIATGGFGDNPEWIKKYTGYEYGRDFFSFRFRGMDGDGIRMAWEVGAAESKMIMQIAHDVPASTSKTGTGFMPFRRIGYALQQPNLMVNLLGERFMNEEVTSNFTFAGNAVAVQKNRCAFMIFDEDAKKYYDEAASKLPARGSQPPETRNFDDELKQALDEETWNIFAADSLEDLCAQTGINLNVLRETIDEYNKACEKGRDELFHKNPQYLRPIKQPKFYANKRFPGAFGSLGGIKINYKTEVLTKDYDVIPGLYAGGVDASAIYGDSYELNLPGIAMSFALSSGRMAAEHALEYIKLTTTK